MDAAELDELVKLAKVGLRATIDEATGYQEVRSESDLRDYATVLGLGDLTELIDERIRVTDVRHG